MITGLDHVVLLVRDIDAGVDAYQTLLGCAPSWRTQSHGAATALFTLANMSLELMAPSGEGAAGERVQAALDKQGEGLASLAFAVADVTKAHRRLTRLSLAPDAITEGQSQDSTTGASMSWQRMRASDDLTHGVRMFFLQRSEPLGRPADPASDAVEALDSLVLSTPSPDRAAALYGARLGLDMALDRTVPNLDTRFLFFRCGDDLIVEIIHRLKDGVGQGPDKIWGLSWRTMDIAAARERLRRAGLEVSEIRDGRKPGSRVATVKTGTFGVPTLLIQQGVR
ncbi:VOC family protein [Bradyrhizobium sp. SYSU BS000235]|uniref:VOC family protein n=1 Tax=Bradyrhizobium sp. SYSU BS000235 TaxID=3411332 RepID=UPI003C71E5D9